MDREIMRGVAQRVIDELDSSCTVLRHEALNQRVELDTLIDTIQLLKTRLNTETRRDTMIHIEPEILEQSRRKATIVQVGISINVHQDRVGVCLISIVNESMNLGGCMGAAASWTMA